MSVFKIFHIYQKYETLREISDRYKIDVNKLIYDNNLKNQQLYDFRTLIIERSKNGFR